MMHASTTPIAMVFVSSLLLSGCSTGPGLGGTGNLTTSSINQPTPAPRTGAASAEPVRRETTAMPAAPASGDADKLLLAARALRLKGDKQGALAMLERGRGQMPGDRRLARDAGLIALDLGEIGKAKSALEAAHDPAKPDWRILSALGTVYASAGNQKQAEAQFKQALELNPGHQPTLNNLALSYALDGRLDKAEGTLRTAAARGEPPPQLKENLALVMALAGKYGDAETLAAGVLPKREAAANVAYVRSLTQSGS
jgi:Flp pilus assembly protein TadD